MSAILEVTAATADPRADCALCPRLAAFRQDNRAKFPDWHNAPVVSFGDNSGRLLIVGLAPGLRGANRTARPFTGDWAGDLLYQTLDKFDFSQGVYGSDPNDGLCLRDCRITNAVRCVPPENKPVGAEIRACQPFLRREIDGMADVRILLALGLIAHGAVLSVLGLRKSALKFSHGAWHDLPGGLRLADTYHCSRYNTNTGRLTTEMFETVFSDIRRELDAG
jgi:uracil-DNA glycosylase family 4